MVIEASSSFKIQRCGGVKTVKHVPDIISELPDAILVQILSSIATKDSARTSILSKRWRNVWTLVPFIDIQDRSLECRVWEVHKCFVNKGCFMNFVDRVLLRSHDKVSCLQKLCLVCFEDYDMSRVREWISVVARLKELDLKFFGNQFAYLPTSIFNCAKFVSLKLTKKVLLNVPSLVFLPNLKDLHLVSLKTLEDDDVKNLLAGCPVLEELYIERCVDDMMKTLYVQSSSLKRLTIISGDHLYNVGISKIVIDAVNLELLYLTAHVAEQIDLNSLSSLVRAKLEIFSLFSKLENFGSRVLELLRKMSDIQYLYLSAGALEALVHGCVDNLPMFKNLTQLEVGMFVCSWTILPSLLESSPNLNSFVLQMDPGGCGCSAHLQHRFPKCSMVYLEKIELKRLSDTEPAMEMVSYFLMNAPALKKMSAQFTFLIPRNLTYLERRISKLPKVSTTCDIQITGRFLSEELKAISPCTISQIDGTENFGLEL